MGECADTHSPYIASYKEPVMLAAIITKQCTKCSSVKPPEEFNRDKTRPDGLYPWCRVCQCTSVNARRAADPEKARAYATALRLKNIDRYRAYSKARTNRDESAQTNKWKAKHPLRVKAHSAVRYAVKTGVLVRQPCEVCSETHYVRAHHCDYNKPLDVMWLCAVHHSAWHRDNEVIG